MVSSDRHENSGWQPRGLIAVSAVNGGVSVGVNAGIEHAVWHADENSRLECESGARWVSGVGHAEHPGPGVVGDALSEIG